MSATRRYPCDHCGADPAPMPVREDDGTTIVATCTACGSDNVRRRAPRPNSDAIAMSLSRFD